jgi:hypothetical protein
VLIDGGHLTMLGMFNTLDIKSIIVQGWNGLSELNEF